MLPFLGALSGEEAAGTPIDPAIPILKKLRLDSLVWAQNEGAQLGSLAQTSAAAAPEGCLADGGAGASCDHQRLGSTLLHPHVSQILENSGRSFCEEMGIDLMRDRRNGLWQWFCAAILFSARIKSPAGAEACKALISAGVESPEDMSLMTKQECRQLLLDSGYDRYDDKAAGFLVDDAHLLLTHYQGDLGKLREAAGRDPDQERVLLKKFKGIGDGGVDIFFREAQLIWTEIFPFADKKALKAARLVGFRQHPKVLAEHCQNDIPTFVRLVATLVRRELTKTYSDL